MALVSLNGVCFSLYSIVILFKYLSLYVQVLMGAQEVWKKAQGLLLAEIQDMNTQILTAQAEATEAREKHELAVKNEATLTKRIRRSEAGREKLAEALNKLEVGLVQNKMQLAKKNQENKELKAKLLNAGTGSTLVNTDPEVSATEPGGSGAGAVKPQHKASDPAQPKSGKLKKVR